MTKQKLYSAGRKPTNKTLTTPKKKVHVTDQ